MIEENFVLPAYIELLSLSHKCASSIYWLFFRLFLFFLSTIKKHWTAVIVAYLTLTNTGHHNLEQTFIYTFYDKPFTALENSIRTWEVWYARSRCFQSTASKWKHSTSSAQQQWLTFRSWTLWKSSRLLPEYIPLRLMCVLSSCQNVEELL